MDHKENGDDLSHHGKTLLCQLMLNVVEWGVVDWMSSFVEYEIVQDVDGKTVEKEWRIGK